MRVFVTGGTGFVGSYVTRRLSESGHEALVLTRSALRAKRQLPWVTVVEGDPKKPGEWQERVSACEVALNLAGASIFTLWTDSARRAIMDSRVLSARNVVDAVMAGGKDTLLINASAIGYYGSRRDDHVLEESSSPGNEFMSEVCVNLEKEAQRASLSGARVARCRFGIVLGRGGGALAKMTPAFRYCLGAPLGSGRQWLSWIHIEDLFRIFLFIMENREISGAVNCVSPNPVRNEEFGKVLGRTLRRPVFLPAVPAFLLRSLLGEFADMVLRGQRVIPSLLLQHGFSFRFPTLQQALDDLL